MSSSEPETLGPEDLLDWIEVNSKDGKVETNFLSDLAELLNRETFLEGVSCEIFHDPVCRKLPKKIPDVAREKMLKIAIASLFELDGSLFELNADSDSARAVNSLAVLWYIKAPASANARAYSPGNFSRELTDVLKTEMGRLSLSWHAEFDMIDVNKIER